jgi:hypothetical protein
MKSNKAMACAALCAWAIGSSCLAAESSGCSSLFEFISSAKLTEIATSSAASPAADARDFVRWRSWAIMGGRLDPLWASPMDMAAASMVAGLDEFPKGAGACVALAARKTASGEWSPTDLGLASQRAVNELAAVDWDLSNQEVARMKSEYERKREKAAAR